MERKLECEIRHNCRMKIYPDGSRNIMVASAPIFRETGWELSDKWDSEFREAVEGGSSETSLRRAKRRARSMLWDYAYSNDFSYFVTLTLDRQKVDRYDAAAVTRKLNRWLDNQVRRKGLRYVLVPERHKDGAIHFHGFFNDALPVVSSGTWSDGGRPRRPRSQRQREQWAADGWHEVFNLPGWSLGFTTAIALYGDRRAAVGYICKYITKAQEKIGGRWYYSGGDLRLPVVQYADVDTAYYDGYDGKGRFRCAEIGVDILSIDISKDGEVL